MTVYVAALISFAVAMALMAVGVIVSNRRLRGSCGGLAGLRDADNRVACDACENPSADCTGPDREPSDSAANEL
jgi:hypothetical protein